MLHITAVSAKEKDNDGGNNFTEPDILKIQSSASKLYSKTIKYYKSFPNKYIIILFSMCFALFFSTPAVAASESKEVANKDSYVDCRGGHVRDCSAIQRARECTVIIGYLSVDLMKDSALKEKNCTTEDFQFVNLWEITDFLVIYKLSDLISIQNMFPKLTVIRGRRLLKNYALLIAYNENLKKIEFPSLIAIQRGHVLVHENPKLCETENINWMRLTLRPGKNGIFVNSNGECQTKAMCLGCKREYCWSNAVCQKIENDSVLSPYQDTKLCHNECLGGCYNYTSEGCAVCKGYTYGRECVETCPRGTYISNHFLRCFTREDCNKYNLFIQEYKCVDSCEPGFKLNETTLECEHCVGQNGCTQVCPPSSGDDISEINHIMDAEELKDCEIHDANVTINLKTLIDPMELAENFKNLREIKGYLEIIGSPYLTSLAFLQHLEKIHGQTLLHNHFALIISNNQKLSKLWNVIPRFEIVNGGMYIHGNPKLCNRRLKQFQERIKHDQDFDSIQLGDQDVLCSPAKLILNVEVLSHTSIQFTWYYYQTSDEVEIIYKPLFDNKPLTDQSDENTEVCDRVLWHRELVFPKELRKNSTHYVYVVKNLLPNTKYACVLQTFNGVDESQDKRSEIKYVTTQYDIPAAPTVSVVSKTHNSMEVVFDINKEQFEWTQVVNFYEMELYYLFDDKYMLDLRNYCGTPLNLESYNEDYDECCTRRDNSKSDEEFLFQIRKEFHCSRDANSFCKASEELDDIRTRRQMMKAKLPAKIDESFHFPLYGLITYALYTLQVKVCNTAGCGSYSMLSTRTNYSVEADKITDLSACNLHGTNRYKVLFSEPKIVNGHILMYNLHFRYENIGMKRVNQKVRCITRLEHEKNNYVYEADLGETFSQVSVTVVSLGYKSQIGWINIYPCETTGFSPTTTIAIYVFLIIVVIACIIFFLMAITRNAPVVWRNFPNIFRNDQRRLRNRNSETVELNLLGRGSLNM